MRNLNPPLYAQLHPLLPVLAPLELLPRLLHIYPIQPHPCLVPHDPRPQLRVIERAPHEEPEALDWGVERREESVDVGELGKSIDVHEDVGEGGKS